MAPPFSYDFWQQLGIGRGNWRVPAGDQVADRFVDTTQVGTAEPFPWDPDLAKAHIAIGATTEPYQGSITGIPIQRIPALAKDRVYRNYFENNTYTGNPRWITVPVPAAGEWVEGNPNNPGAWDQHVILVCPETRESWEMIGVNQAFATCLAYAHYRDGVLVDGMHVCAGQRSMAAVLTAVGDANRRRGVVLNDYIGWDGTKQPGSGYPRCGDVFRLKPAVAVRQRAAGLTAEQRQLVDDLERYGFVIFDRGGDAKKPAGYLGSVPSSRWKASTLPKLVLTLGDFDRVVSSV